MGPAEQIDHSRSVNRPRFAQLKANLPGEWILHEVSSITTKREGSLNFQVLVRFRSKADNSFRDIEVPIEWFPLLVEGTEWASGQPKKFLSQQRGYEINPRIAPFQGELSWDAARCAWVPYESDEQIGPRKPALILHTLHGNQLWVARAELLRSFYFPIPRAIVCFLSGLSVHGAMSSAAFELWRPHLTGWVDRSEGVARIQRSRNLSSLDAKRIAKIILHDKGAAELADLWSWVQFELRIPGRYPGLPPLGLPFDHFLELETSWAQLPAQAGTGVKRRLATRITMFRSDEPFARLIEGSDNDNRQAPPLPEGCKPRGWGRTLTGTRPDVPVSIINASPDSDLDGFELTGVGVRDLAAEDRRTELSTKEHIITEPSAPARGRTRIDVESLSLGSPAERGTGAAPAVIGGIEPIFSIGDLLRSQSFWIKLAIKQLEKDCAKAGVPFAAAWLPAADAVYVFRSPANNTDYAKKRSISRCFLVAQITLGGRVCYMIDPERRVPSDTFPIGVVRGKHDPVLQYEDIDSLAEHFETAHRKGMGWLNEDALPEHVSALSIRRSALKTEEQRNQFSKRAAKTVLELIEGKPHLMR